MEKKTEAEDFFRKQQCDKKEREALNSRMQEEKKELLNELGTLKK